MQELRPVLVRSGRTNSSLPPSLLASPVKSEAASYEDADISSEGTKGRRGGREGVGKRRREKEQSYRRTERGKEEEEEKEKARKRRRKRREKRRRRRRRRFATSGYEPHSSAEDQVEGPWGQRRRQAAQLHAWCSLVGWSGRKWREGADAGRRACPACR